MTNAILPLQNLNTPLWIEILNPNGTVRMRTKVEQLPITMGRAYTNDIIIDDEYVSDIHLRVHLDSGCFTLEDLGSMNGFSIQRKRFPPNQHTIINEHHSFSIGKTCIRIRSMAYQFPEVKVDTPPPLFLRPPMALFFTLSMMGVFFGQLFSTYFTDNFFSEIVAPFLMMMTAFFMWNVFFFFIERGKPHKGIWGHLSLSSLNAITFVAIFYIGQYSALMFQSAWYVMLASYAGLLSFAYLTYRQLFLSFHASLMAKRSIFLWTALLTLCFSFFQYSQHKTGDMILNEASYPIYPSTLILPIHDSSIESIIRDIHFGAVQP